MKAKSLGMLVCVLALAAIGMGAKSATDARLEALEKAVSPSSVTLKSPDGKNTITISAKDNAVGIWLSRGDKDELIAIYSTEHQNCIGMYAKGDKGSSPIAMGIGLHQDGKPYIQYKDGDETVNVSPGEL